ncbi:hypothetical protein K9O30_19655 [Clostridium bowmanii]|uniref:hypothetical protein n=1 Tax=Clostridium bowmanii TaxID=132925 RepID=UPI001C0BF30F|nr:hypothetical protein [Clostridium bowmanii]MBU3191509.1 hypothetical protein [Clostridium bowmanii]MCA1075895.1 hypothetical protein [Clostridium bowmanii]
MTDSVNNNYRDGNDENKKITIDLSPKILKDVSILSIILIIFSETMDLIFNNFLDYHTLIPLILLFMFCEYSRK